MINLCIRICYNGISPGINCLSTKKKKEKSLCCCCYVLFLQMGIFFKLIKIEEEKKKKERLLYCAVRLFSNVYFHIIYIF